MKKNVPSSTSAISSFNWRRAGLAFLFAIAYSMLAYLTYLIVIIQIVWTFFAGTANANIQKFSRSLRNYVGDIIDYVSYNSEIKPFPFSPWPVADAPDSVSDETHSS